MTSEGYPPIAKPLPQPPRAPEYRPEAQRLIDCFGRLMGAAAGGVRSVASSPDLGPNVLMALDKIQRALEDLPVISVRLDVIDSRNIVTPAGIKMRFVGETPNVDHDVEFSGPALELLRYIREEIGLA